MSLKEKYFTYLLVLILQIPVPLFAAPKDKPEKPLEFKVAWTLQHPQKTDALPNNKKPVENARFEYSPLVSSNEEYIIVADKHFLYKIKAENGEILQKRKIKNAIVIQPLLVNDFLYIYDKEGNLTGFSADLDEKPVWTTEIKNKEIIALSLVAKNLFLAFKDGRIIIINPADGAFLKDFPTGEMLDLQPEVDNWGDYLFIASANGIVSKLSINDGKTIWRYDSGSMPSSAPVHYNGRLYIAFKGGRFIALDTETGTADWELVIFNDIVASAVYYEGEICFSALNNQVYCCDKDTGTLDIRFSGKKRFYLPPIITDGLLFAFPFSSGVLAGNLEKEKTIGWMKYDKKITVPVAILKNKKYLLAITSDGELQALDYSDILSKENSEED